MELTWRLTRFLSIQTHPPLLDQILKEVRCEWVPAGLVNPISDDTPICLTPGTALIMEKEDRSTRQEGL